MDLIGLQINQTNHNSIKCVDIRNSQSQRTSLSELAAIIQILLLCTGHVLAPLKVVCTLWHFCNCVPSSRHICPDTNVNQLDILL